MLTFILDNGILHMQAFPAWFFLRNLSGLRKKSSDKKNSAKDKYLL